MTSFGLERFTIACGSNEHTPFRLMPKKKPSGPNPGIFVPNLAWARSLSLGPSLHVIERAPFCSEVSYIVFAPPRRGRYNAVFGKLIPPVQNCMFLCYFFLKKLFISLGSRERGRTCVSSGFVSTTVCALVRIHQILIYHPCFAFRVSPA